MYCITENSVLFGAVMIVHNGNDWLHDCVVQSLIQKLCYYQRGEVLNRQTWSHDMALEKMQSTLVAQYF